MTQYNILSSSQGYNVTSSPLVRDSCFESKCSFTQSVETTGALYIVTMASINAVGIGPWSDPKQGKKDNYSAVESINCIGLFFMCLRTAMSEPHMSHPVCVLISIGSLDSSVALLIAWRNWALKINQPVGCYYVIH